MILNCSVCRCVIEGAERPFLQIRDELVVAFCSEECEARYLNGEGTDAAYSLREVRSFFGPTVIVTSTGGRR